MVGSLFISGNSLFADTFDDCFELERLRAKSDGLGAVEAAEQASQICKAKLGGTQRQTNTSQNNNLADDSKKGVFASFNLAVDITTGSTIKGGYKFNNARVYYENVNLTTTIGRCDFKGTYSIYGADYIANSGFLIGVGYGEGTLKQTVEGYEGTHRLDEISGPASAFKIGYLSNKKKGFQWGVNFSFYGIPNDLIETGCGGGLTVEINANPASIIEFGYVF